MYSSGVDDAGGADGNTRGVFVVDVTVSVVLTAVSAEVAAGDDRRKRIRGVNVGPCRTKYGRGFDMRLAMRGTGSAQ